MTIVLSVTEQDAAKKAAAHVARLLNEAIADNGFARIMFSTGRSQFELFIQLLNLAIDWTKVEMFHLDEFIGIPVTHKASFRLYLWQRFISKLPLPPLKVHFVNPDIDVDAAIAELTAEVKRKPIDVALIGIGENGHIAFNDPPADFDTSDTYHVVTLDEACRNQQLGEGWFDELDDVPKTAISFTVPAILNCTHIISMVPLAAKADAVYNTLTAEESTPDIPATALKKCDCTFYLDNDSASRLGLRATY
ncbi:MAG: 6-phosphogluconolactonase [Oscillospiraceae bacterium]|nr:6-phosphogluconolactonase [Oscillospiraceae bacterium]